MPLTFLVILVFNSFPETRWLADVMMVKEEESSGGNAADTSSQTLS